MAIEVLKFKPYRNGNMVGFCDIKFTKMSLVIYGCSVFNKKDGSGLFVNFPSREGKDKEGKDKEGKKAWFSIVKIEDKDLYNHVQKELVELLEPMVPKEEPSVHGSAREPEYDDMDLPF